MHRLSLIFALVVPMACGSTSSGTDGGDKEGIEVERKTEKPTEREVALPKEQEVKEFQRIWELYRKDDPRWPRERNRFKAKSPGAANMLATIFLKYYMEVNAQRDKRGRELVKIKNEIVEIGAPAAPYLVDLIVLDRIKRADGQYFIIDDLTRQDCIDMLERMGGQAVPYLLKVYDREDVGIKGRRMCALALGGTGDKRAYDMLVKLLKEDPSWQVRADACSGLGELGDRRALNHLNRAIMQDKDRAVRSRAEKARREIYASMGRPR